MKVMHMSAPEGGYWKWFDVPKYKGTRVELRLLTRTDLQQLDKYKELKEEAVVVAQKYFRDFEGCFDCNGQPIPNTENNRALMMEDTLFGTFVTAMLADVQRWRAEGKEDSASDS